MNVARQFYPGQPAQAVGEDSDTSAISLIQIRQFLVRQWRLIALVTCFALVVGAVVIVTSPVKYTAQADMIIDTKCVTWTQAEMSSENRMVEDASVESEIETTKSEKVALAVIRKLKLTEDPEFVGGGTRLLRRILDIFQRTPVPEAQPDEADLTRRAMGYLKDNLRVVRLGRSYIEQISFTSLDREKAARVSNAVADAYIEDQLQAKFEATRRASDWLQQRIGELRDQASNAYREVQDFKSQNSIIIGVDGKLASEVELDQLGIALAKARADTSQAKAKVDRVTRVLEQGAGSNNSALKLPDPVVTDALSNPVITRLRQQFLDDQNKESEWSARYRADRQAARNLRAEMAALQRAIWDEITRISESYKSELQIAQSQEAAIDKRMIDVFQQSATTRQSQVRLRELETAANTYRGIYETFLTRFTQSVQQQSFPSTEARIVTLASAPFVPSSPKTTITMMLSGVCGLSLGLLLAFAREQMNRKIYTRRQVEEVLGINCLAVLPNIKGAPKGDVSMRGSQAFRSINKATPFSATAEALRYIKVAIDLHPKSAKVIGVVSCLPGEGKTTVTASLASFIARGGAKVLLIDGDLRNPSMTKTLGFTGSRGLLNLVTEEGDFRKAIVSDEEFKFDFIPAAAHVKTSNGADILTSNYFKNMLKSAKAQYDYVFVDLPPVLPVVDVKAAAHLFETFLMVIEWGKTSSDELGKMADVSSVLSERLLGAVLNKVDQTVLQRFEGYSDRRYEYYSDERSSKAPV